MDDEMEGIGRCMKRKGKKYLMSKEEEELRSSCAIWLLDVMIEGKVQCCS